MVMSLSNRLGWLPSTLCPARLSQDSAVVEGDTLALHEAVTIYPKLLYEGLQDNDDYIWPMRRSVAEWPSLYVYSSITHISPEYVRKKE